MRREGCARDGRRRSMRAPTNHRLGSDSWTTRWRGSSAIRATAGAGSRRTRAPNTAGIFERYAIPFLGRLRLEQITPRHIAQFIAWMCDEDEQGRRDAKRRREAKAAKLEVAATTLELEEGTLYLADATVRRVLSPIRACLRTATAEGLIRHNPTVGAALPARDDQRRISLDADELEDDHDVRALTDSQLAVLLTVVPERHRLLFELVAATGVRISEALALRWGDLEARWRAARRAGPPRLREASFQAAQEPLRQARHPD